MSKFKVGDKVRIKTDLKVGRKYGEITLNSYMKQYAGEVSVIVLINDNAFKIVVDNKNWWWTDGMVDKLPAQGRPKGAKNKAKKVIKVPKCPKTLTGNHKFIYQSHSVFSVTNGTGGAGSYIDDFLSCKYCGIVDDREVKL